MLCPSCWFSSFNAMGQLASCQTFRALPVNRHLDLPYSEHVEVAFCQGKALIFCAGQPEAKRQNGEGEGEEAGDDKKQRPQSETIKGKKGEISSGCLDKKQTTTH